MLTFATSLYCTQHRLCLPLRRLEHSLGVAHLAWTTAMKIAQFQAAELDWPQREQASDIKVIQMAGECSADASQLTACLLCCSKQSAPGVLRVGPERSCLRRPLS